MSCHVNQFHVHCHHGVWSISVFFRHIHYCDTHYKNAIFNTTTGTQLRTYDPGTRLMLVKVQLLQPVNNQTYRSLLCLLRLKNSWQMEAIC